MKIVAYLSTLMFYAHQMGQAEKRGDTVEYEKWKRKHDDYKALCLREDVTVQS